MKYKIDVSFGEKILTFHFGLSFLGYFYKKYDLDVVGLYEKMQKETYTFIPKLMFESYKHNLDRQGKEAEITELELMDLIDETGGLHDDNGSSAKFLDAFINSILVRLGQDVKKDETSKKK